MPGIHAAVKHAKRLPPGACLLEVSMDHRVKPGGDESESGVTVAFHSSGAKTRRENAFTYPPLEGEGRAPRVRGVGE